MSTENGYSLCVLCCCSFGQTSRANSVACRTDLTNLFKVLLNSPPERDQEGDEKCIADLDQTLATSGLSVCTDCHAFVTVALETRSRTEQMEMNVRKLQVKILEQLRALNSEMDLFHQEMTKIENVVKTSDESCLKFHIPRIQITRHQGNGVMVLRERILDVVTDLRIYQVNCNDNNRIPVDESEMEAMWEDAQQLVQCTPDISLDYNQQLSNNSSNLEYVEDDYNDSSGAGGDGEDSYMVEGDDQCREVDTRYMGHSVGTDFYVEGESDSDAVCHTSAYTANPNFKMDVIQRALVREQNRTQQQNLSTDPLRRYFLKYDKLSDNLCVGNVQVTINEADETLQCSKCSIMGKRQKSNHQSKQNWRDMEKGIVVHIIGKHLGGFTCTVCKEVFTSHTMIKKHFSKEHFGQTVASAVSDDAPTVPLISDTPPISVIVTEKSEKPHSPKKALMRPMKPTKPLKPYVCSMCSHAFGKPSELKRHFLARHAKAALETAVTHSRPCPASRKKGTSIGAKSEIDVLIITPEKPIPLKSTLRPHECHICKYAFTKGSHLKRHLEVHRKRNELV